MGQSFSTERQVKPQISGSLTKTCPSPQMIRATPLRTSRAGNPAPPPSGTMLLKNIQMLATLNDEYGDIADAAIYIKGNVIQWVGKTRDIPKDLRIAESTLDLSNRIVIPGLVCCHHHMYQGLTRLRGTDESLYGWWEACLPAWCELKAEDVHLSCKLEMTQLVMNGCTTSSDDQYVNPNDVKLDDAIRAAREVGIRFQPARATTNKGDAVPGRPCPPALLEDEADALKDMKRCIEEFHDDKRYSMLQIALGAEFNSEKMFKDVAELANKYKGVQLHTHVAENPEWTKFCQEKFGTGAAGFMEKMGWNRSNTWIAHGCQLTPDDVSAFAKWQVGVAHCPCSNSRLADGICPVRGILDANGKVGLGVDGSSSNETVNLMDDCRIATYLQRSGGNPKGLSAREALLVATQGSAKNLGRDDVGMIAPGMAADLVAWRTDTLTFAGTHHDLVEALVFTRPGQVDLNIINGKVIVQDGSILTVDVPDLLKKHNARALELRAFTKQPCTDDRTIAADVIMVNPVHQMTQSKQALK